MHSPRVIGLIGYAGVGKDTAAKVLTQDYGYVRIGFADPLKQILYAIGWDGDKSKRAACECCGLLQGRELLQVAGTEGVRRVLGDGIWTDHLANEIFKRPDTKFVVSDVRFRNEADRLRDLGAMLVRIHREGQVPAFGHSSETEVDRIKVDHSVLNGGSVEQLRQNLHALLDSLRVRA